MSEIEAQPVISHADAVARAAAGISSATLAGVNCTSVAAEIVSRETPSDMQLPRGILVEMSSGLVEAGLFYNFKHHTEIRSVENEIVAIASCTHEVLYDYAMETEPSPEAVEAFGISIAAAAVHPYAAETIRILLNRIDVNIPRFGPLVEPLTPVERNSLGEATDNPSTDAEPAEQ